MKFDYLTLHPDVFGLDISDLSVKIAQLKEKDGRIKPVFFSETNLPKGLIEEGVIQKEQELASILKGVLKDAQKNGLDTKYVVAALPEERAFLQVVQLPKMKREDLAGAVRFEAENYIPYALETVYLSHQVIREVENHLDILIASLPREVVDSYLTTLLDAGFVPVALEVESLAISRALIQNQGSPEQILLIDLGKTNTNISIFSENSIRFATSLPVSSDKFTKAIVKTLGVKPEEAERLKQAHGVAGRTEQQGGKDVFEALVPVLTDFVEQIRKHIDYYESHAKHEHMSEQKPEVKKAFLVGGGALLKGFSQFLAQSLKLDIALGNPWVNIIPEGAQEVPEIPFVDSIRYTTALGTALRGIQKQNLLPQHD